MNAILKKASFLTWKQVRGLHYFDSRTVMDVFKRKLEALYGRVFFNVGWNPVTWLSKCIALGWHGNLEKAERVRRVLKEHKAKVPKSKN